MFCSNCGSKINDKSKFCKVCGALLAEYEAGEAVQNSVDIQKLVITPKPVQIRSNEADEYVLLEVIGAAALVILVLQELVKISQGYQLPMKPYSLYDLWTEISEIQYETERAFVRFQSTLGLSVVTMVGTILSAGFMMCQIAQHEISSRIHWVGKIMSAFAFTTGMLVFRMAYHVNVDTRADVKNGEGVHATVFVYVLVFLAVVLFFTVFWDRKKVEDPYREEDMQFNAAANQSEPEMLMLIECGDVITNQGTWMRSCVRAVSNGYEANGWAEYNLDYKYSTFSGTLSAVQNAGETPLTGSISLFKDNTLCYSSPFISGRDMPVDFMIDVSDCRVLWLYHQGGDPFAVGNFRLESKI